MRARWVKPEFFRDKKMAELGPVGALVFQALWIVADDGGMAPCDPDQFKGEMFYRWATVGVPDIEAALRQLFVAGRIKFYQGSDELFCQILNWDRHQRVHLPSKFRYREQYKDFRETLPQWCGSTEAPLSQSSPPRLLDSQTPKDTPAPDGAGSPDNRAAGQRDGKPNPAREWARPYYEPWVKRFGGRPNVGFLRKQVEPLEQADGRELTIKRWQHLVAGLNPRFFGKGDPFKGAVLRFAGAPAAYDDADWHLSDRDRADVAQLRESLGLP